MVPVQGSPKSHRTCRRKHVPKIDNTQDWFAVEKTKRREETNARGRSHFGKRAGRTQHRRRARPSSRRASQCATCAAGHRRGRAAAGVGLVASPAIRDEARARICYVTPHTQDARNGNMDISFCIDIYAQIHSYTLTHTHTHTHTHTNTTYVHHTHMHYKTRSCLANKRHGKGPLQVGAGVHVPDNAAS